MKNIHDTWASFIVTVTVSLVGLGLFLSLFYIFTVPGMINSISQYDFGFFLGRTLVTLSAVCALWFVLIFLARRKYLKRSIMISQLRFTSSALLKTQFIFLLFLADQVIRNGMYIMFAADQIFVHQILMVTFTAIGAPVVYKKFLQSHYEKNYRENTSIRNSYFTISLQILMALSIFGLFYLSLFL